MSRDDRQAGPVVVNYSQAILELENFRHGQIELRSPCRLRRVRTPCGFRVDGFPACALTLLLRLWSGNVRPQVRFAGDSVHHNAGIGLQLLLGERADRRDGSVLVPRKILREIVRCTEVVIVFIQPVGNAAKSSEPLKTLNGMSLEAILRALEFGGCRTVLAERCKLLINGLLNFLGSVSGPRGHGNLKDGSEDQRILRYADVERDLLLVDKLFVKPAGFAAAENVRSEIGESVTRLEDGRSEPGFIDARQFHLIVNHGAPLRGDGRC